MYKIYELRNGEWTQLACEYEFEWEAWDFVEARSTLTGKSFDDFRVVKEDKNAQK